jgi:Tol biopolymer transport system component
MTTDDQRSTDVGALLTAWFEADAPTREPDGLVDGALVRTVRVHPLPIWRLPERWIPMQLVMWRPRLGNAVPIVVVLALLVALAAALLLIGPGRRSPVLPAPDGLAGNGRLVYVAGGDLLSANDQGTDVRTLIDGDRVLGQPVWSHDGTRFAYKAYANLASTRRANIMVADADGSHQVTIAADVWDPSPPSWSRDDRTLMLSYSTDGMELAERLYTAPSDGSTPPARLAHDPGFAVGAGYSPDGTLIVYESGTVDGGQTLWLAMADGSDARQLTTGHYYDIGNFEHGGLGFAWSPDGTSVLFAAGDDQAQDLYVIGVDQKTPERRITTSPLNDYAATYAPDGRHIAWLVSPPFDFGTLMIADSDGSGAHPALLGSTQAFQWYTPRWSPDARFIAATTGSPDPLFRSEVWIIDVASRTLQTTITFPEMAFVGEEPPGHSDTVGFQRIAQATAP